MNKELLQLLGGAEDKYPHALAQQFPHIVSKIIDLWRFPEINQYFSELMLHTRTGTRKGFPSDVIKEILDLSLICNEQTKGSLKEKNTNQPSTSDIKPSSSTPSDMWTFD